MQPRIDRALRLWRPVDIASMNSSLTAPPQKETSRCDSFLQPFTIVLRYHIYYLDIFQNHQLESNRMINLGFLVENTHLRWMQSQHQIRMNSLEGQALVMRIYVNLLRIHQLVP